MNEQEDMAPVEVMWSPSRVATYLGVTRQTVYNWILKGKIRDVRKIEGNVRIPQSEVQRIMNATRGEIIHKAEKRAEKSVEE